MVGVTVERMWWCAKCCRWAGSRLVYCCEGHKRPRGATLYGDVADPETYNQRADDRRERLKRVLRSRYRAWVRDPLRSVVGRLARWSA